MDCRDVQERLIDRLYGELPLAEAAAVEEHLAGCSGCRRDIEGLAAGRRLLDGIDGGAGGAGVPGARPLDLGRLYREAAARGERGRRRWRRAAAAAALLMLVALGAAAARCRIEWRPGSLAVSWRDPPAREAAPEPAAPGAAVPASLEGRVAALEDLARLLAGEMEAGHRRDQAAWVRFERDLEDLRRGIAGRLQALGQDLKAMYVAQFAMGNGKEGDR